MIKMLMPQMHLELTLTEVCIMDAQYQDGQVFKVKMVNDQKRMKS